MHTRVYCDARGNAGFREAAKNDLFALVADFFTPCATRSAEGEAERVGCCGQWPRDSTLDTLLDCRGRSRAASPCMSAVDTNDIANILTVSGGTGSSSGGVRPAAGRVNFLHALYS